MKRHFTLFLCTLFLHISIAQTFPYTFTVEHNAYLPLKNAISVNDGEVWDDLDASIPLGFEFEYFGSTTESLYLFGEITANNVLGLPSTETPLIISYGADLIDRGYDAGTSLSPILYRTEGAPGSRIFKMEWANAGFFYDETGNDFINTQLWLYEGSNDVELHFGPVQSSGIANFDFTGPLIGFMASYMFAGEGEFEDLWFLQGSVDHPVVSYISSLDGTDTLSHTLQGTPGDGTVYRFATGIVHTNDPGQANNGIQVYPSLVSDAVSIAMEAETDSRTQDVRYAVLDALGKTVRSGQMNENLERVEMSGLPGGLYYIHLFSPNRTLATKKITKI